MAKRTDEDDLFQHTSMTFGEHLEELRSSLFKAVLALGIGFGIGLYFAPTVVQWIQSPLEKSLRKYYSEEAIEYVNSRLPESMRHNPSVEKIVLEEGLIPQELFVMPGQVLSELKTNYLKQFADIELPSPAKSAAVVPDPDQPADKPVITKSDLIPLVVWRPLSDDERTKLVALEVQEGFMIWIKAALLFGAIVSSPFVFYFLWSFVAAGLYPHEKKYIHTFLPVSLALFICGAALAFTFVFPPVLRFFFAINKSMGQSLEPRATDWMSFVLLLPLGFGISFQLPLVMLFLDRIHVFNVQIYLAKWRIAVLVMAVAAMILSPGGDPNAMVMMLVPLIGLYFAGIALCKWLPTNRSPEATAEKTRQYADVE
jgi:sec-independent protein translocase protein TatC